MTHWGDQAQAFEAAQYAAGGGRGGGNSYVPPHLRGMVPGAMPNGVPQPPAPFMGGGPAPYPTRGGYNPNGYGPPRGGGYGGGGGNWGGGGGRGGGGRGGGGNYGRGGGGNYGRGGNWDSADRDGDPFAADNARKAEVDTLFQGENTGINFEAYEDIPVEATGQDVPAPIKSFEDIELGPALMENVRRCKYSKPTPVQRYSIPIGMAGRDLMACAQTGSGKTAAFCFPIIANILASGVQPGQRGRKALPLALVLSPTRELSSQIHDEARKFAYQTGLRSVVVYGGAPVVGQVPLQNLFYKQCPTELRCTLTIPF